MVGLTHAGHCLLDKLVRVDNVRRLDRHLALLSSLEEVLEMFAALHAVLDVRVAQTSTTTKLRYSSLVTRLIEECLNVLLEATPRNILRLNGCPLATTHGNLSRLQKAIESADLLAIDLHSRSRANLVREETLRDQLRQLRLTVLAWDPLRQKRQWFSLSCSIKILRKLLLDEVEHDGDNNRANCRQLKEVAP